MRNRYGASFEYGGRLVVLCRDCSTRSNGVMVEVDERDDHDAMHDA